MEVNTTQVSEKGEIVNKNDLKCNKNSKITNNSRCKLILWFLNFILQFSLNYKIIEYSILLYDKVENKLRNFGFSEKQIFLLALFSLSLKINFQEGQNSERKIFLGNIISKFNNSDENNIKITKTDIHMSEIYILNLIDWDFSCKLISQQENFLKLIELSQLLPANEINFNRFHELLIWSFAKFNVEDFQDPALIIALKLISINPTIDKYDLKIKESNNAILKEEVLIYKSFLLEFLQHINYERKEKFSLICS
jgi:hypothetical protein